MQRLEYGRDNNPAVKRKTPSRGWGFWVKTLAMTYSRMRMHTTIGVCAFHFRVRNGIGWDHAAIVTRERVEGRGPESLVALTLSLGCVQRD